MILDCKMTYHDADVAKEKVKAILKEDPAIRGIGIGQTADGEIAVRVDSDRQSVKRIRMLVPPVVNGIKTVVAIAAKVSFH